MNPYLRGLFDLLDQIDTELEHGVGDVETVRSMKPEEVFDLIRFARSLRGTSLHLEDVLVRAEQDGNYRQRVGGIIDSPDHPVFAALEEQRRQDRQRSANICRRGLRDATNDIPSEPINKP